MAKELFNSDFYTLPEQVQINKDDIKKLTDSSTTEAEQLQTLSTKVDTNTANIATNTRNIATNTANIATNTSDITKLQDDISKIKPNAWVKNTSIIGGEYTFEQYIPSDFNPDIPYSFVKYNFDNHGNPTSQNIGLLAGKIIDSTGVGTYNLGLVLSDSSHITITDNDISFNFGSNASTIGMKYENGDAILFLDKTMLQFDKGEFITQFTNSDSTDYHNVLTAHAINQYYLKKTDASSTYLTKTDASNTYVTKQDYDNRFEKAILTLTEAGFNKIKTMVENEGTTITLTPTSDFTEQVPPINPNNMKEIRLNVKYDVESVYSNIHLVPNTTTDDYNNLQGSLDSYWYTGHAMLNLPSQDNGYFVIAYQKGGSLILRLIMHY